MKILALALLLTCACSFAQTTGPFNGTTVGTPTYGAGKFGQALTATSDANYVVGSTGAFTKAPSGTFTMEAWLKTSTVSGLQAALSSANQDWIGTNNGVFTFNLNAGGLVSSGIYIADGAWHHCAISSSGTVITTWVDGQPGATFTSRTTTLNTVLTIGKLNFPGGAWPGSIDEIAFWTTNRYTAAFTPPVSAYVGTEAGLNALYHLDGNALDAHSVTYAGVVQTIATPGANIPPVGAACANSGSAAVNYQASSAGNGYSAGQVASCVSGAMALVGGGGSVGGVNSVGLSMPSALCSVSSSPVVASGVLTCQFATGQAPNQIFSTDSSGNAGLFAMTTPMLPSVANIKSYLTYASTDLSDSATLLKTVAVVANSTSFSTANAVAINAALATGGNVSVACGVGSYVSVGTIVLYSGSTLNLSPGCALQQATGQNGNVIVNHAYLTSFVSSGIAMAWTSGMEATLTWPSHGLLVGNYVWLKPQFAALSGTFTYVSGASSCTNGTQAVTISQSGAVNATGTVTVSGGVPTGNVSFTYTGSSFSTVPTTATVATCTGTATLSGGSLVSADPEYAGVFPVKSVVDSNTLTIVLRRTPAVAPTGSFQVKQADTNITVNGALIDYNSANNPSPTAAGTLAMIFAGVAGLNLNSISGMNTAKYLLAIGGARDVNVNGLTGLNLNSDGIKIYGPCFDCTVQNVTGQYGDDVVSIQPQEAQFFRGYDFTGGGNTINNLVTNVHATGPVACAALYTNQIQTSDQIHFDRIGCHMTTTIAAVNIMPNSGVTTGTAGSVYVSNIEADDDKAAAAPIAVQTGQTINHLRIEHIRGVPNPSLSTILIYLNGILPQVDISDLNVTMPTSAQLNAVQTNGTIGNLKISDYNLTGSSSGHGYLLNMSGNSVATASIMDGVSSNLNSLVYVNAALTASPIVNLERNTYNGGASSSVLSLNLGSTINVAKNTIASAGNGFVRVNGTITVNVNSNGGNTAPTGKWLIQGSGTSVVNLNACDFQVDISAALVGRPVGGCAYNTNSSVGAVGPTYFGVNSTLVTASNINATVATVTSSATPAFNFANGSTQVMTLTSNVTGFTVAGLQTGGKNYCINFVQGGSGGYTVVGGAAPASVHGFTGVATGQAVGKQNYICWDSVDGTNLILPGYNQ